MYKLIDQMLERHPLIEPLALRTKAKEVMKSNISRSLGVFFDELILISQLHNGIEVSGIALINRFTGDIIYRTFRPGTENECVPPVDLRMCIRPSIIQVLAHNHPSGVCDFSEQDEETIHFRFNASIFGLGVLNLGIDDESYVITYDRENSKIKFKEKRNRLW